MKQEILVSVTTDVILLAKIENSVLTEIIAEKYDSLLGNIYRGQITRVLPGMKAAFVDIGLKQPAFLPSDCLIHQGQTLLAQVVKESVKNKQARITTKISIPSRYIILLPYSPNLFKISNKITSIQERQRLKNIILSKNYQYGFIIRTVAEGVKEQLLLRNIEFLYNLWQDIQDARTNSLLYKELPVYLRAIRDLIVPKDCRIIVDSYETYQQIIKFTNQHIPNLLQYVEYYSGARPLFDLYKINIKKLLEPKVALQSGGYIVIETTEAMTTIDVNTGSYTGQHNLAETILKTNLEAAVTIAKQLQLRNISGIIIIDFIDMKNKNHKQQVIETLHQHFINDYVKISNISSLGLVEMTRKYTRNSLRDVLCKPCPTCKGDGIVAISN